VEDEQMANESQTDAILILVDNFEKDNIKTILPRIECPEGLPSFVRVPAETLSKSIKSSLACIMKALSECEPESNLYEVDQVKFNMCINANGQVGLLSAIKLGVSPSASIEFTIRRNSQYAK
jgi:hypothetical protein